MKPPTRQDGCMCYPGAVQPCPACRSVAAGIRATESATQEFQQQCAPRERQDAKHQTPENTADWDDGRAHVEDELRCTVADLKSCIVGKRELAAALRDILATLGNTAIVPPQQLAAARDALVKATD
jgi:hypothetical protein